jgi:hypothetical protein
MSGPGTSPDDLDRIVTTPELHVLLLHEAGYGRRAGSLVLGISEDAWRWRLANARRKITAHHSQQEEAA